MILPLKILNQIEYYKLDISPDGKKDIYILYYKSFWKLPKVITFQRILVQSEDNPESIINISSNSSLELLNQLNIFFDPSNELIKITKNELVNIINYVLAKTDIPFQSYDDFFDFLRSEYNSDLQEAVLSSIDNDNHKIIPLFPKKTPPK
jgi:hypothetical protein